LNPLQLTGNGRNQGEIEVRRGLEPGRNRAKERIRTREK